MLEASKEERDEYSYLKEQIANNKEV